MKLFTSRLWRATSARRGSAVVLALIVVMTMLSTGAALMTLGSANQRDAKVRTETVKARFLADGAIERVTTELQDLAQTGGEPPAMGTVNVDGIEVEYEAERLTPVSQEFDADGLMSFVSAYRVTARGTAGDARIRSSRIVNIVSVPVYQFALFWENDLEIWPGPDMVVGGRVHSNADMYVGSGNSLTLDTNYVRVVGDLHHRRKHSDKINKNDVFIRRWVADPFDAAEPAEYVLLETREDLAAYGVQSPAGYDSDFEGHDANDDGDFFDPGEWFPFAYGVLEKFEEPVGYSGGSGSTLKTGDHGVTNADLADVASIAMYEAVPYGEVGDWEWSDLQQDYIFAPGSGTHDRGPFHDQAGLAIITKPDGSWKAYDGDGNDLTFDLNIAGAVSVDSVYDGRQAEGEAGEVLTTIIDLAALRDADLFPENGLLYASAYGMGEGTDAKGVMLTNGAELSGPLTVATEGSLYVHGDYNTVNKQPAAVLGDAVNLLSNAWTGNKGPGDFPSASDTTFNTAIVSGNTPSSLESEQYNGGVENFPRLHENWSGKTLSISGSMVCPWFSKYATAPWKTGAGYYSPPRRDWYYDTDFNDPDLMPPFALVAATVENVVSW